MPGDGRRFGEQLVRQVNVTRLESRWCLSRCCRHAFHKFLVHARSPPPSPQQTVPPHNYKLIRIVTNITIYKLITLHRTLRKSYSQTFAHYRCRLTFAEEDTHTPTRMLLP